MKIYTKVGDGGNTVLIGGKKVPKTHPRVECCGDLDELNAWLGFAAGSAEFKTRTMLQTLQKDIFTLSAQVANPKRNSKTRAMGREEILRLEAAIDDAAARLPALTRFVLPGGAPAGAALHLARAVCRRAERRLVAILIKDRSLRGAQIYLNRLSDFLFLLARLGNQVARVPEVLWLP